MENKLSFEEMKKLLEKVIETGFKHITIEERQKPETETKQSPIIPQYQTKYHFELVPVKCEKCGKVDMAKNQEVVFIREIINDRLTLTHHFLCRDCYNEIMCDAINNIRKYKNDILNRQGELESNENKK